jgi:kumamolisin
VLTVDSPASGPAITAAGGTTRPYKLTALQLEEFFNIPQTAPTLIVPTEQVWGWDYLQNYLVQFGGPVYQNSQFPGGGGVSIFWPLPPYQSPTPGLRRSEPGQSVVSNGQDPADKLCRSELARYLS